MDLIVEIILRMEVKHILRCKLISKTFYSLIKSPSFISAHLHRPKADKRRAVFLADTDTRNVAYFLFSEFRVIVPPLDIPFNFISLMGSCNGLLCILTTPRDKEYRYQSLLCNPATGEYRALPMTHWCGCNNFGFGYDVISGDYKVVKICRNCFERRFLVSVWSMATNEWTTKSIFVLPNILEGYYICDYGLFVGGSLYWMARTVFASDPNVQIVFSVSLADHKVRQIPMPDVVAQYDYDSCYTYLTEYMGILAMFVCGTVSTNPRYYDLWVMKDIDEEGKISWAKQVSNIGPFLIGTWPTRVCVNGDFVMLNHSTCKTILYNLRAKEITEIPHSNSRWFDSKLWNLDESLVSLKNS